MTVLLNSIRGSVTPQPTSDFVTVDGTNFISPSGEVFCWAGINTYDFFTYSPEIYHPNDSNFNNNNLTPLNHQPTADRIDAHMAYLKSQCVNVVRTWLFSHGTHRAGWTVNNQDVDTWHAFEPYKGVYHDDQFVMFDYIIDSAERHGIYLVPCFENWFLAYGGLWTRLKWEGEGPIRNSFSDMTQFFDRSTTAGAAAHQGYLDYVTYCLNRTNVFTNRQYKDEPAIASWELMNEPRVYPSTPEMTPGTILRDWVDVAGAHVKSIDSNHLLGTGQEGQGQIYGYFGNGSENGAPFVLVQQSPHIDWASAHYYPAISGQTTFTQTQGKATLCAWANDAHNTLGKPFVLGEYGVPNDQSPAAWMQTLCEAKDECPIEGIIPWWAGDGLWPHHMDDGEPYMAPGDPEWAVFCNCIAGDGSGNLIFPPVASDVGPLVAIENSLTSGTLVGLVSDPDNSNSELAYSILQSTCGTVNLNPNGGYTFTSPSTAGTCSFTYQVCDPDGQCDTGTVTYNVIEDTSTNENFITVSGTNFLDPDGNVFYFAGANAYDTFTYTPDASIPDNARIDAFFAALAADCVKVLRLWMFSNESWHGFEPSKGVYNEDQFKIFDYIIDSAGRNGVYLIPVFDNWNSAYGGIDQRLAWEGVTVGGIEDRTQFFARDTAAGQAAYQSYLDYITFALTRINTINGIQYRNDPTIMSWQLINEPRVYTDPWCTETVNGQILRDWVDDTALHIKTIDPNHLVGTGQEGQGQIWGYSGNGCQNGAPFTYVQQSPLIDYTSGHIYPEVAGLTPAQAVATIQAWVNESHNVIGKPFLLGEWGQFSDYSAQNKLAWWNTILDAVDNSGANGSLYWNAGDGNWSWHASDPEFIIAGSNSPEISIFCTHAGVMQAN